MPRYIQSLEELDDLSRWYLIRVWVEFDLFPAPGEWRTLEQLRQRLYRSPKYDRLLKAHCNLLAAQQVLELRGDGEAVRSGPVLPAIRAALTTLTDRHRDFVQRYPDMVGFTRVLEACLTVADYGAVLQGQKLATEILFPDSSLDLVTGMYRDNPWVDHFNQVLAAALGGGMTAQPGRPLRVLEVGAGTGSTTQFTLPAVAALADRLVYDFTDVSQSFLQAGKAAFGQTYPFMQFRLFDLDRPAEAQGFELGVYDAIVATNVVHATRQIQRSLSHLAKLLKPGGLLLLNELTRKSDCQTITVALLDGWWAFEDPAVRWEHSPLLPPHNWVQLLAEAGLTVSSPRLNGKIGPG